MAALLVLLLLLLVLLLLLLLVVEGRMTRSERSWPTKSPLD